MSGLPLRESLSYLIDVVCCQNCECADGADETGGGGEAVQRAAASTAPYSSSRLLPAQTCPEDTQVPPTLTGINSVTLCSTSIKYTICCYFANPYLTQTNRSMQCATPSDFRDLILSYEVPKITVIKPLPIST